MQWESIPHMKKNFMLLFEVLTLSVIIYYQTILYMIMKRWSTLTINLIWVQDMLGGSSICKLFHSWSSINSGHKIKCWCLKSMPFSSYIHVDAGARILGFCSLHPNDLDFHDIWRNYGSEPIKSFLLVKSTFLKGLAFVFPWDHYDMSLYLSVMLVDLLDILVVLKP